MSDEIVIGAVGTYFDGLEVRQRAVSSRRYHDPALAAQLDFGTFLPVLREESLSWSESIRFQPQGGTISAQVSDLSLIATGGEFDDWPKYIVAGHTWTLKRGRPDQAWADWEELFVAVGLGIEWRGGREMIIRLRDKFANLAKPVSQEVFDDGVPNERYRNRLAPAVFGDVQQVAALVIDPAFSRVYAASNLALVRRVTEGGRPTSNWTEIEPDGYKVTQSIFADALQIAADISGPPVASPDLSGLIPPEVATFASWTSDDPDGWSVYESPPDSEISEDTVDGGATIASTFASSSAGSNLNAGTTERIILAGQYNALVGHDAGGPVSDPADWPALIDADDAEYIEDTVGGGNLTTNRLKLTDFGGALGPSDEVTGVTVEVRADNAGSSDTSMDFAFEEVRLVLPSGVVTENKAGAAAVTNTKTLHAFGGANDRWNVALTPDVVNDAGFGVRLQWRSPATGTFPIRVRVYEVIVTLHTGTGSQTLRLYYNIGTAAGERVRLRLGYDDKKTPGSEDAITARWACVAADGDPIPDLTQDPGSKTGVDEATSLNVGDPTAVTEAVLTGAGTEDAEFIADGPWFGIEFFVGPGQNGAERLTVLEIDPLSAAINRFKGLVRYIVEDAGYDPDIEIENAALDAIVAATGDPRLGWYVRNETGRDQLLTTLAHSVGSAIWGGIYGTVDAAMMALPAEPSGSFLKVGTERCMGDSTVERDAGAALRDRVHAGQNIDPLREGDTAGATKTWPESQRQKVLADWRITERADFDRIEAGPEWPKP